jgi:protease-4
MNTPYPHILSRITSTPWAVTPETLDAIERLLNSRLTGAAFTVPDDDDEEEDDDGQMGNSYAVAFGNGIEIIPVHGILGKHLSKLEMECGGCSVDQLSADLRDLAADETVRQVVLYFNSPGGAVTGIPELAQRIAAFPKPIHAFCDAQCCSAAYWLASQCDSLTVTPTAQVGSVGVYVAWLDNSEQMAREGIKLRLWQAGEFKALGLPGRAISEKENAMLQTHVNELWEVFKANVREGRWREIAEGDLQGQSFSGLHAINNGMADDAVLDFDDYLKALARVDSTAKV